MRTVTSRGFGVPVSNEWPRTKRICGWMKKMNCPDNIILFRYISLNLEAKRMKRGEKNQRVEITHFQILLSLIPHGNPISKDMKTPRGSTMADRISL
jgi:hypothetical protein